MRPATTRLLLAIMVCVASLITACEPSQEAKRTDVPVSAPPPAAKNGKAETARPPAMANGPVTPQVLHHAYDLLAAFDSERPGYAVYTYVLFGRRVGAQAPSLSHDVAQRYQALLAAIESSTSTASELEAANIPKDETNLFNIPAISTDAPPTLDNYASGLALQYRSMALGAFRDEDKFRGMLSHGAGPFLISVLRPLNQVRSPEPLLFADLSAHNPAAMREVVAAYKQRINRSLPDRVESFESLRLDLLTLILDADNHVKLVKDAVADWRNAFPEQ
ncbi:MAG: hypothetical protein Q8L89_04710 [Gammaproteobacteria bacterium]|nr:hypothetical protein [Gammaproteobacteria bacterium]